MTSLMNELTPIGVQWKEYEYAVYQYTPNQEALEKKDTETHIVGAGFSLSLVGSSISADREHLLRAHVGIKMSQGTLYKSSGLVTNMDPQSFPPASQSYISRIDAPIPGLEQQDRQFLICFVYIGKQGLDLFRNELDGFCESLVPFLKALPAEGTAKAFSDSQLEQEMEAWFPDHVAYVGRVLKLCQAELPILLHIAVNSSVEVLGDDQKLVTDVKQFLEACSLANLMQLNSTDESVGGGGVVQGTGSNTVTIHVTDKGCNISATESSKFCENWAQVLLTQGTSSPDPFFLRQAIENYKLKIIQDINALKRLLRQAESNYHALYRCYVFLCACGNGQLLLQCAVQEAQALNTAQTVAVLNALQTFAEKHPFDNNR